MKRTIYILLLLTVMTGMTSCTDTFDTLFGGGIDSGDEVVFTTMVPDAGPKSRSAKEDWANEIKSYTAVNREYTFDIEMWKQGAGSAAAKSQYQPASDLDEEGALIYPADGTLKNSNNAPLYWQDNVSKWGFKATAGTKTLGADQTDQEKWLAQDRLIGYSYLPIWKDENVTESYRGEDNINAINYRTSKEWYADNKLATQLSGIMADPTSEDFKKIPLFLQHQRSWVTVILKAGEGVTREALAFATSSDNIKTTIYSYAEGQEPLAIDSWSSEYLIDYATDKNGPAATDVSTTRYDAIVEPHNFIASRLTEENDIIVRISVSEQNFTFAAGNDQNYRNYVAEGSSPEKEAATQAMQVYNLEPGKHLTITATLSRESRMIMITAWIEDWTETVTQTICDDYGQNGDPILINYRSQLIDFLNDPELNKAGNMAMIVPNALALDSIDNIWDGSQYELKATLNLASTQLTTSQQFVNSIDRTGSIINGEIRVTDSFNAPTVLANTNYGTVERVRVTTDSETSPARATVAGLIGTNYGTIYQSTSAITVQGTTGYVGGIAAQSLYSETGGVMPVIDACTVSARVDGSDAVTAGGGIVGRAEGRVSNNTFDYGITLLQNKEKFKNIVADIGPSAQGLTASNNSWPTTDRYTISSVEIVNKNVSQRYDAIIDRRDELKALLTSAYNAKGRKYRVANSFTVDKENWIWGTDVLKDDYFATNSEGEYSHGTLKFTLDGNDKTITLTGATQATMLFGSVIGEVYDLNLFLDKPIVADRIKSDKNDDSNTDGIAAFCYAVTVSGEAHGAISNITLKGGDGVSIKSSTPGGIAVWATRGGKLTNCVSNVPVLMNLSESAGTDARHYAGGIVACAEIATITQCKYYGDNGIGWDAGSDNSKKSNCRYGGIVGGTSEIVDTNDNPNLRLSDNYSWWNLPTFSSVETERPVMGSIIGSTVYHDPKDATKLFNAMADDNAGNWWVGTKGAGLTMTGVTEEKAIGKKNSVTPTKPSGW